MPDTKPCLTITYSKDFFFDVVFSSVQGNPQIWPEYCFDISCRIRHSKGEFAYLGRKTCFDPETFRKFAEELEAIRQGKGHSAKFHEVGYMIEFSISVLERKTKAAIRVREFQAGEEETVLTAAFHVDYDLFVNALQAKTKQFVDELASVDIA